MSAAVGPVTVQYFYKIRWGFQDEWVDLFERNHWPLLRAQKETGRIVEVHAYAPRFHGDGRQDWHFEVTIPSPFGRGAGGEDTCSANCCSTWRDWAAIEEHTEPSIVQRLYPDAEKLRREEQRRFELLDAHWDAPLEERALPS